MRILVLGATGMLGHQAVRAFSERHEVHATARDPERARGLGIDVPVHAFEAESPAEIGPLLATVAPDAVLNCIGVIKQRPEAAMPVPSIAVNSLLPHLLARACAERGTRLVHVSTDCVFSGELPYPTLYTEDDVPDARDLYGRSKLLGETPQDGALTLRTSIIGWEPASAYGLLEWLVSQQGRSIKGFSEAWFSGLTTPALARLIDEILTGHPGLAGLYHVSAEPISKLDLVTRLDTALDLGCEIEAADEPRINRALDSSRFLSATSIASPSWDDMVSELAGRRLHDPQP